MAMIVLVAGLSGLLGSMAPSASALVCVRLNLTVFGNGPLGTGSEFVCI